MIEPPLWIRGATVAAALGGLDGATAVAGFRQADARAIAHGLSAFRSAGNREAVALAIARERLASTVRAVELEDEDAARGARVAASLLRTLTAELRGTLARSLDPALLRAASAVAATAPRCDAAAVATVVAAATRVLGRTPTAVELGAIARVAAGVRETRAPAFVHATLRRCRALGSAPREALAHFVGEAQGNDA